MLEPCVADRVVRFGSAASSLRALAELRVIVRALLQHPGLDKLPADVGTLDAVGVAAIPPSGEPFPTETDRKQTDSQTHGQTD